MLSLFFAVPEIKHRLCKVARTRDELDEEIKAHEPREYDLFDGLKMRLGTELVTSTEVRSRNQPYTICFAFLCDLFA